MPQLFSGGARSPLVDLAPDAVVIVGDDQEELFSDANMPAVSIYYGDRIAMHPYVRLAVLRD